MLEMGTKGTKARQALPPAKIDVAAGEISVRVVTGRQESAPWPQLFQNLNQKLPILSHNHRLMSKL